VYRLARLGFAAKGLVYVIAGATAALAVVKVGGRPVGTRGALNFLAGRPFGRAGLALAAVGLGGFILRRLLQIFVPPEGRPRLPVMRYLRRASSVSSLNGDYSQAPSRLKTFLATQPMTDILVNDHAEVDALLRGVMIAFDGGDAREVFPKLDYLWARLAEHNRLEEGQVYLWETTLLRENARAELRGRMKIEIENLPPRFAGGLPGM
jgi:hypothetical protein